MKQFLLASCMLWNCIVFSQSVALKTKSFAVKFGLKNAGLGVNGYFKTGSAVINYNEKKLEASTFSGSVVVNSLNTGIGLRDKHLMEKDEFFQPINFPEIKMVSTKVVSENGKLEITWNLTMKGITKSITAPASYIVNKDGTIGFASTFKINRRDWNVGKKAMLMGDTITIDINVLASK
jgi:polyisoprenoid-binding protein YceI